MSIRPLWFVLFAVPVACSNPEELVHSTSLAIIGGTVNETSTEVVMLQTSTASCSATLIAPNLVMTAAHCIAKYGSGYFTCAPDGTIQSADGQAGKITGFVAASDIGIYPGTTPDWKNAASRGLEIFTPAGARTVCMDDIALVRLDKPITGMRLGRVRLSSDVEYREAVRVIGYGSNPGETIMRRERSDLVVLAIGSDGPSSPGSTTPPRTFTTGLGPCHGDSGGPAVDLKTGAVIGVFSEINTGCTAVGNRNVFTKTAPNSALILKAFKAAGAQPREEGAGGAGGAGGATGSAGAGQAQSGAAGAPLVATAPPSGGGCSVLAGRAPTTSGWLALLAVPWLRSRYRRRKPRCLVAF